MVPCAASAPAPGSLLTFLLRLCRTTFGQEIWIFGDGSAPVTVKSDGCAEEKNKEGYARTQHVFRKPGDYIVRAERANERERKPPSTFSSQ